MCQSPSSAISFQVPGNGSIDARIDEVLPNVTLHIQNWNLDPFYLGDLGTLDLSACWMHGLSTMYRAGSWHVTFLEPENAAVLQAAIGFRHFGGSCRFSKRVLFYNHRGTIAIRMDVVSTYATIRQALRREAHPTLLHLDVEIPGEVELESRGSGVLSFVLDALQALYRRRMKYLVRDTLKRRFQELVTNYLSHVTLDDIEFAFNHCNYSILLNSSWFD